MASIVIDFKNTSHAAKYLDQIKFDGEIMDDVSFFPDVEDEHKMPYQAINENLETSRLSDDECNHKSCECYNTGYINGAENVLDAFGISLNGAETKDEIDAFITGFVGGRAYAKIQA